MFGIPQILAGYFRHTTLLINLNICIMKKITLLAIAIASVFTSCSTTMSTIPTSSLVSHTRMVDINGNKPIVVTNLMADLEVSPNKITFFYIPTKSVNKAGYNNVVETAVREALIANNNADVLVNLDKQVKFDHNGAVESITVSGYPAKYVNFRSLDEKYILELSKMYLDLNLKLVEEPAKVVVPNFIPNILPEEVPGAAQQNEGGLGKLKSLVGDK